MHWSAELIITIILDVFASILAIFCLFAGFRLLTYRDLNSSRSSEVATGLMLCSCGLSVFAFETLFTALLVTHAPAWLWVVSVILACLAFVTGCIGMTIHLTKSFVKIRREALEARESGEGFWIGHHGDS